MKVMTAEPDDRIRKARLAWIREVIARPLERLPESARKISK